MNKVNIIVISQNVKLESLSGILSSLDLSYPVLLVTTHHLFENEIEMLCNFFISMTVCICFNYYHYIIIVKTFLYLKMFNIFIYLSKVYFRP